MNVFPIPVKMIGPGSQPQDAVSLDYAPLPPMEPFVMPRVYEVGDSAAMAAAAEVIDELIASIASYAPTEFHPRVKLSHMTPQALGVLNETLGQGELSILVKRSGTRAAPRARIQETAFPGLWRVMLCNEHGIPVEDTLEVGDVPELVRAASASGVTRHFKIAPAPEGVMNAPALLRELQARVREFEPGAQPHVITLTLLPLTPQDLVYLESHFSKGRVTILSRGFGNCRIAQTGLLGVWRVQYFNSMETMILNTLEISDFPEAALASREDISDTARRLAELLAWMREDAGERRVTPGSRLAPDARMECGVCWHVYDPGRGDEVWQIPPGTPFAALPEHWSCPNCAAEKTRFLLLSGD